MTAPPIQLHAATSTRRRTVRRVVLGAARAVRWLLTAMGALIALPAVVSVLYDHATATPNPTEGPSHVCTYRQPATRV
jgi:hypothetical protein